MNLSLLTYNLLFNKAAKGVGRLLLKHKPDIICFQELITKESEFKKIERYGYKLADYSNSFIRFGKIFGVATFYNPKKLTLLNSDSINLRHSLYEIFLFLFKGKNSQRTVLKTGFKFRKNGKNFTVYNIHLSPLATNSLRAEQIEKTYQDLDLAKKDPVLIAGDFNYPYGRKKFETLISKQGLKEATNGIYYTLEKKIFRIFSIRLKLDYILYKKIDLLSTDRLFINHSDHFPILSRFKLDSTQKSP